MKDNLLKLLKMNSKELKEFHDCGRDTPYIKVTGSNDAYCGNCKKKLYDYRTDRFSEEK
jgi:hypothetical protein